MTATTLMLCGAYACLGFIFWEFALGVGSSGDDALMVCERYGARSAAEALAFLTAKGLFVALWPSCVVVYVAAQSYLRLRVR